MKRLFRIFELSKNEQRVILIVMLLLLTIAFIGYQCRISRFRLQVISTTESKPSPSPVETDDDH